MRVVLHAAPGEPALLHRRPLLRRQGIEPAPRFVGIDMRKVARQPGQLAQGLILGPAPNWRIGGLL
jgi:hypothetical protein